MSNYTIPSALPHGLHSLMYLLSDPLQKKHLSTPDLK